MKRKLQGAVVVLTGASSGIGRVTAQEFAVRGSKLVLAARERDSLEQVATLCRELGADAVAVPTDVRDEAQVQALRDAAVSRFGRIDVWVNDAGVYMLGAFERVPADDVRAILDTNVMGVVHGAKAAIEQFRRQGQGTLINIGSLGGKVSYAQASAYCASKHAVHGLSEALRQETLDSNIEVCLVAPATIDTPLFQHAANYTGREIRAMPPIYPPERVARAIVRCAENPRREVVVGTMAHLTSLMQRWAPALFERMQPRMIAREHLGAPQVQDSRGNFEAPMPPHSDVGGWKQRTQVAEAQ